MVLMGLDGASTNMGAHSGIAVRSQEPVPWVLARHCGAHNLELAVIEPTSNFTELQALEVGLKGLYARYVTAKQWGSLKDSALMADALKTSFPVHRFISIHGIRWLASQTRTIKAVLHNQLGRYCNRSAQMGTYRRECWYCIPPRH